MQIIGHRGASGDAPENTLAAFNLAFEQKADGIECDIFEHNDTFYVIHDHRLERTTNGRGPLLQTDHQSLRALDAGDGESIPTLDEVMTCVPPNKLLNIEIKYLRSVKKFVSYMRTYIDRLNIDEAQIIVSSFHHGWLHDIHQQWPQLAVAYLIAHYPLSPQEYVSTLPSSRVNVALDVLDKSLVEAIHSCGKQVWVYTVNSIDDIQGCKDIGVDGIFTNYPKLARSTC